MKAMYSYCHARAWKSLWRRKLRPIAGFGGTVLAAIALTRGIAAGASLIWDFNGSTAPNPNDGAGTWQTLGNWWNGTANVNWNNATPDDATFGTGAPSTTAFGVSLGTATTVGTLTFANYNYTINNLSAVPLTVRDGLNALTASGTVNTPIILSAANTWNAAATRTLFIGGPVSGGFGITKTGAGTLSFNGSTVHTYTGPTTVNGGTLALTLANLATPTNLIDPTSALVMSGGTLTVTGKITGTSSQTFASTTLNAGASSISVNSNGGGGTTLNLETITRNPGSTVNFTLPSSGAITTKTANTAGTILGGWATVGSTDWAVSAGTGAVAGNITALSSYTNDTWAAGNNTTVTGSSTVPTNGSTNSLRFANNGSFTVTLAGANTITSGGILVTSGAGGATTQTLSGGTSLTSGTSELFVHNYNSGDPFSSLTISTKITGAIGLVKSGTGALRLNAANDFTGATTVNAGLLTVGNANALASSSSVTIGDGAVLTFLLAGVNVVRIPNLTITGTGISGIGGALANNGGQSTIVLVSPVTVAGTGTAGGGSLTPILLGGSVQGNGGTLSVVTFGLTVLAGNNSQSGGTTFTTTGSNASVASEANLGGANSALTFSGGTLKVVGTAISSFGTHAVTFTSGSSTSIDVQDAANTFSISQVLNQGTGGLTKVGAGTLKLTGNNTYTGSTSASGGTLTLDYGTNNGAKLSSTSTLQLGGATLNTNGAAAGTQSIRGLVINAGASVINTGANNFDFNSGGGTVTRNAGGALDFTLGAGTITLPAGSVINTGWATVGNDFAKLNGSNQVTAFVAGDYTTLTGAGASIATGATTTPLVSSASTGNVTLAAAATVDIRSLNINDATGRTIDVRNGTTQEILRVGTVGGILTSGGSHTIGIVGTAGTLTAGGADGVAGELVVINNGALTINSVIANNAGGVVTFTKSGSGLLTLTGTNTYSGQTYLNGGITSISALANLGTGTAINFNGGTLRTSGTFSFGRQLLFNGNGGTLDVTSGTVTIDFVAAGNGGMTKTGAGTLVLSALGTFHGGIALNDGIVRLSNANSNLLNPLSMAGAGRLQLNGTNFAVTALNSASTSAIIESNSGVGGTDTFVVGNGGDNTYAGILRNGSTRALALHKTGAGTLTLTNNGNTFTGGTTVSGGKLRVDGTIGAVTVQDGGTLGGSGTVGNVIVQSGGTVSPGASPAIFNTAALSLNSGAHLTMEINGVTAGSTYDRIVTSSTVNLNADAGAGAILDLTLGYVPVEGDLFFLIVNGDAGSTLGTFASLPNLSIVNLVSTANSQTYTAQISYVGNLGTTSFTGGNDVAVRIIPEPASATLLASGFAMLLGWRRRRVAA